MIGGDTPVQQVQLKKVIKCSQGIQVPREEQFARRGKGMRRFLRIVDFTTDDEPPRYINEVDEKYYKKDGELIMIRYGAAGRVFLEKEGYIANNIFKISILPEYQDKILLKYLYYFFLNDSTYDKLAKKSTSGTMPAIKFDDVYSLTMPVLPMELQKSIVKNLDGFLDNFLKLKVDLKQEMELRDRQFKACIGKYYE